MDFFNAVPAALDYIRNNPLEVWGQVETHLKLCAFALLFGIGISFPLGTIASRNRYLSVAATNAVGLLRAIPSVAILFLAYPYLDIGFRPAVFALTILACPPVLINTTVGFRNVDPAIREAAYGMGMTTLQVLGKIELPLALPVVIAGIRTATVEVIASATLATFIGAGGLGDYIAAGLANFQTDLMLVGALTVAALTLTAELTLGGIERVSRRLAGVPS
jgi:osmoprotectant transport system permease protein